jgi:hypothetical protein
MLVGRKKCEIEALMTSERASGRFRCKKVDCLVNFVVSRCAKKDCLFTHLNIGCTSIALLVYVCLCLCILCWSWSFFC